MDKTKKYSLAKSLVFKGSQTTQPSPMLVAKGEKGDKGDTPIFGVDYMTSEQIASIMETVTPVKGVDYMTPQEVRDFADIITPIKGVDYYTKSDLQEFRDSIMLVKGKDYRDGKNGLDGYTPQKGIDYRDGKDGSPDTAEEIAAKINTLQGSIDAKVIRGVLTMDDVFTNLKDPKGKYRLSKKDIDKANGGFDMNDMRWHGGGLSNITGYIVAGTNITITGQGLKSDPYVISSTASSVGYQSPTGTVNGTNQSFTFTTAPNAISVDGVTIQKVSSDGTINWNGTTSIILSVAPNFDIFGIA